MYKLPKSLVLTKSYLTLETVKAKDTTRATGYD